MSSSDFKDWTPEEKKAFAEKRMLEMRLKNEKLMKRHTEVENDRLLAESRNSAITGVSKSKKDNSKSCVKANIRKEYSREWDRGKPSMDSWDAPEQPTSFKQYRTAHRENQGLIRERETYNQKSKSFKNRQYEDYQKSRFPRSPKSTRAGKQMKSNHNRKRYSTHSRSSSRSESDFTGNRIKSSTLWRNDRLSEDQNKKHRLGKWLKDVNKSLAADQIEKSTSSYSKFDRFEKSSADSSEDCSTPCKAECYSGDLKKMDTTFSNKTAMKNKRSPQTSSNSSSKNGHMRKRMLFDHGPKKVHSLDDKFPEKKNNAGAFKKSQDNWRSTEVPKDDGNWESVDQSDINWKLSDDETHLQEPKFSKNDLTQSALKNGVKQDEFRVTILPKQKRKVICNKDTGVDVSWADRQESDASSKLEVCRKLGASDGWGEYESAKYLNEISEKMKLACTIKDKMEVEEEKNGVNDGWSTVSEEGEIHTEDEDADKEWKN